MNGRVSTLELTLIGVILVIAGHGLLEPAETGPPMRLIEAPRGRTDWVAWIRPMKPRDSRDSHEASLG